MNVTVIINIIIAMMKIRITKVVVIFVISILKVLKRG